jgi:ubiquinone/menaquinone biosynthesis C-methylase UbiE
MYPSTFGKFVDPKIVSSHFHLQEGDVVADFGAGSGHYMKPLAQAVGRSGKVYLCEIQRELVDALGIKAREDRISNAFPLWCDIEALGGVKLSDGILDAGLLSNVLFQFTNKESALREISRVMKKGAKIIIIDWSDSFGGLGPQSGSIVTEAGARTLLERAGFTFERSFPAGDHHYGVVYRK